MINLNLPLYNDCKRWIRNARDRNFSWEEIRTAFKGTTEGLAEFLEQQKALSFWPDDIDTDSWLILVDTCKEYENKELELSKKQKQTVLIDAGQDSEVVIPDHPQSSWQLYRSHLISSGFKEDSVEEIERATIALLKRLNRDTTESGPVKGLVIGHVQSGKTANMAALMAMAADWGWNFFIVLSGTIDNLRKQTQSRILKDLNHPGEIHWTGLEHLSKNCSLDQRPQELRLEDRSPVRYFTVCLKNPARLKDLLKWMLWDLNKLRQMKIILIDDEADQASINTSNVKANTRTRINDLIVNIVECNNEKGVPCSTKPKAMNYISYTATPYANFLNESLPESLYPKSFIRALQPSDEYFGPKQIFGIEETDNCDGLNILRSVSKDDLEIIKNLHDNETDIIPTSMKESICWFLCASACMRFWGYSKPISMLVHTSQRQMHHDHVSVSIRTWIECYDNHLMIDMCRSVWEFETQELSKTAFRDVFDNYGRSDNEIRDYPDFDDLVDGIMLLLEKVTNIPLNEEKELQYTPNIHLCIDNCAKNNSEEEIVRLVYPDSNQKPYPSPAPVFIVVGGSTLSRGLTIEGLVSTYFLRSSCQADTLMQMGRWFGYRRGYELLPRIWMSDDTIEKFKFLAQLEESLRDDLHRFTLLGASPLEYGPRVKNSPNASWLRITTKKKMQSAMEVDMDFTGTSTQTILFYNDKAILSHNISITESFIDTLGSGRVSDFGNSYVWENIDFSTINDNLFGNQMFLFHERARVFNAIDAFSRWVKHQTENGKMKPWTVIVTGNGKIGEIDESNSWNLGFGHVGKVNRSRKILKNSNSKDLNIGVLRSPADLLADIKRSNLTHESWAKLSSTIASEAVDTLRKEAGVDDIPQLIIYRINKDSKASATKKKTKKDGSYRSDLNAVEDIIGICISIPGKSIRTNNALTLTIQLDHISDYEDLEENE